MNIKEGIGGTFRRIKDKRRKPTISRQGAGGRYTRDNSVFPNHLRIRPILSSLLEY